MVLVTRSLCCSRSTQKCSFASVGCSTVTRRVISPAACSCRPGAMPPCPAVLPVLAHPHHTRSSSLLPCVLACRKAKHARQERREDARQATHRRCPSSAFLEKRASWCVPCLVVEWQCLHQAQSAASGANAAIQHRQQSRGSCGLTWQRQRGLSASPHAVHALYPRRRLVLATRWVGLWKGHGDCRWQMCSLADVLSATGRACSSGSAA